MKSLKELSWVLRGKQRRDIIQHIEGVSTPSDIARKSGYSLNNTSRVLNDLKEKKLVKLLNPEDKTGRLYTLEPKGKTIKETVKKQLQK